MGDFVHLHLHSEYSLLDGACRIEDIPAAAKAAGHSAVAITDHGVMYGVVDFYRACKAEGIKPIIGCEVYVADGTRFDRQPRDLDKRHLVLLVKNEAGYKNLIYIVTKGFTEGFYQRPGIDLDLLREHHEGIIALSACLGGRIPQYLINENYPAALSYAKMLADIFGEGNFYLELQDHMIAEQKLVNTGLARISRETGIPLVATNDIHYIKKKDASLQSVLMCVQTNSCIADGRPLGFETDEFYYKSTDEMEQLFGSYPDAIENTVKIADMCSFDFDFSKRHIPSFRPPEGFTADKYIRQLAADGLKDRLEKGDIIYNDLLSADDYRKRIDYELVVITSLKYSEYFLIVWDFVNYAKQNKIPTGPGRGSGAGSLIAYLLRITDVDPLKYNLLFETFLNPERISMPDFDIDFCYNRRDEVIEYVKEKYGAEHVSQIITFGTFAARAAVRDVGRALGMSYSDVDTIARMINQGESLNDALTRTELKKQYESNDDTRRLIDNALAIEGMPRHASTHAAGVVITNDPVWSYVPLAKTDTTVVTQFDMDTVASVGLLKFDFLALRYLTIISDTERLIRSFEREFDIEKVSLDDRETYELISSGATDGVFQLESGGMRRMLIELKPECIEDIMVAIALYRPGPMDSIPRFIENRRNRDSINWKSDLLREYLDETCGCIVYQEQVMQIFRFVAGYSYGKADIVRRAIAKKKQGVIEQERETFIAGAAERGLNEKDAETLFSEMIDFSNYGFKKSHAAAYSLISFRTAYLKTHYFPWYMATLLGSVLGWDGKVAQYIDVCEKAGVRILPPDINRSGLNFSVEDGNIRFGLLPIKNVGKDFAEALLKQRKSGEFTSFENFIMRMSGSGINRRMVEALIYSGACDRLGVFRSQLLDAVERLIELHSGRRRNGVEGQLDFFISPENEKESRPELYEYANLLELPLRDRLHQEKLCTGISFSGHLLDEYSRHIAAVNAIPIIDILRAFDGSEQEPRCSEGDMVITAGIVIKRINKQTRGGADMAFVTIEDRFGELELVCFPKVVEDFGMLLLVDTAVAVYGELSAREEEPPKMLVRRMTALIPDSKYTEKQPDAAQQTVSSQNMNTNIYPTAAAADVHKAHKASTLYLRLDSLESQLCKRVLALASIFEGSVPLVLYDSSSGKYVKYNICGISPTPFVLRELRELLGDSNVAVR